MTLDDLAAYQTTLLQFVGPEKTTEQNAAGRVRPLTDVEKAWLAGVIDGEGSIFITKITPKTAHHRRGFYYSARLEIANSNPQFLLRVLELLGKGSTSLNKERRLDWKDKWQYTGYTTVLKQLLPQILPYLVVKRKVAEKMLEYLAFADANQIDGPMDIPEGHYEKVDAFYHVIRKLNEKGSGGLRDNGDSMPLPAWVEGRGTGHRAKNCRTLTEPERAWLAAIIDGEGTIMLSKRKCSAARRGFYYIPSLEITNSNKALLIKILVMIGEGGVYPDRRSEGNPRWKKKWIYNGSAGLMRVILPQILPFLIIKKEQAKTMLEYLQYVRDNPIVGLKVIPAGYYDRIDHLYMALKKMNEKGKGAGIM
ncbi:MAG: hypothetical protein KGI38_01965 [Thaumarchaeota archaeon]|nr:hypothetical protein [Nitrososphaerota archaeon]